MLLNLANAVVATAALLLLSFAWKLLKSYRSGIPGPFWARLTRLWLFREVHKGRFHVTNLSLHQKYGPIVRIRPNEYSIDDPSVIKTIYGAGSHFTKSDWYSAFTAPAFDRVNLFTLRDTKTHSALRRQISAFYSLSYLSKYESFVDNNTRILHDRLRGFARTGEIFDLAHWLQCYAFDVITEITFGRPFGFLKNGDDVDNLIKALESLQNWGTRMGFFPSLHYLIATTLSNQAGARIPEFTIELIKEREQHGKPDDSGPAVDFLTLFLNLCAENPSFTQEALIAGCAQNIGAGSDTTGISLTALMCNLIRDPVIAGKILEEIKSQHPDKDGHDVFSLKEAQALRYLQASIKETLRLHPAAGMPFARRVPKGGVTLVNRYFEEGVVVGMNPWVAHQNKKVFGNDAEKFRPERWIDNDPETASLMERYYIPFGVGSRTCIGKNISLLEISKVIPSLLQSFTFELQPNWEAEYNATGCDWFVKPRSMPVSVVERQ